MEARAAYLAFATAPGATSSGNFRDLAASVTCMATLAPSTRITSGMVEEEIVHLRRLWSGAANETDDLDQLLSSAALEELDPFDRVQLRETVRVCRASRSLSEAGRTLFSVSRRRRTSANDADRLRKYLQRFGLDWQAVSSAV